MERKEIDKRIGEFVKSKRDEYGQDSYSVGYLTGMVITLMDMIPKEQHEEIMSSFFKIKSCNN